MKLPRIALSLALATALTAPLTACLDDPDAPLLDESTAALYLEGSSVSTRLYGPVAPAVFRDRDWRVQVVGINSVGNVAFDFQADPGLWGTPAPSQVSSPLAARHVAIAQDSYGRTVVFAVAGTVLLRTQQTQPGSRLFNNWSYVDTAVLDRRPSVVANQDGRLEVAYVASNGAVKRAYQITPGGNWTSPAATGTTTTGTPVLTRDRSDRLELFVPRATVPCGFTHLRQQYADGVGGWTAPTNVAGMCMTRLAVGYADQATDVLGQIATGTVQHHTRHSSTASFSLGGLHLGADPAVPPAIVMKDDGRLFAFTGMDECPPGQSSQCRYYVAAERRNGAWTGWNIFLMPYLLGGVAGTDSIINNTHLFFVDDGTRQYRRAVFR